MILYTDLLTRFDRVRQRLSRQRLLIVLLLAGLVHGLIYIALVPPWQHYDEPSHFEFAWLVAERGHLPSPNDSDPELRRAITASLIEHNFFGPETNPNLVSRRSWIGITQLGDEPLYYAVAALPLRLMQHTPVVQQLYATRILSLISFLATIAIAYLAMVELTGAGHPLRWMVPSLLILTPAYVDLMTALNNDVGATVAFSLFLLMGIRVLLQGSTIRRWIAVLGLMAICVLTKNTVFIAIPLVGVLMWMELVRRWSRLGRLLFWGAVGIGLIAALLALTTQDSRYWYREGFDQQLDAANQAASDKALGPSALRIFVPEDREGHLILIQPIPLASFANIEGQEITLGAWMWADQPTIVLGPQIWTESKMVRDRFEIGPEPRFVSVSATLPRGTQKLDVVLSPQPLTLSGDVTVFADGLVLTAGRFVQGQPEWSEDTLLRGDWQGQRIENLIRNPSAEAHWLTLRPPLVSLLRYIGNLPAHTLSGLQDLDMFSGTYRQVIVNLFQSFWARFVWNHVRLDRNWYRVLAVLSVVGLLGTFRMGLRRYPNWSLEKKQSLIWLGCALFLAWLAVLMRPSLPMLGRTGFIPNARYIYPPDSTSPKQGRKDGN